MIDYREILRLHAMKQSQSTLRGVIHCSDHTIRTASEATAEKKGVSWPLDADVTNADLERLLFPDKYKNTCANIEPDYQYSTAIAPAHVRRPQDKSSTSSFLCMKSIQLLPKTWKS